MTRFNTRFIFIVFHDGSSLSYFLYLYLLLGGASLSILSGPLSPSSLRSVHLSFPLLRPLTWFLTVTSCLARLFRWLLSMFYPNFFSSGVSLDILSGSSLLSPLFSLSFPFPPLLLSPLCPSFSFIFYRCLPKAASPNVTTPYDPKWSLAAMSCAYLRWCAHVLPPLSHTPPMLMVPPTLLDACGYLTLWCCFHLMRRFSCRLPSLFLFGFDQQPPCTLWCRLRAARECRRHVRATAAYLQTVSWPPLPFFQQIPAIFS